MNYKNSGNFNSSLTKKYQQEIIAKHHKFLWDENKDKIDSEEARIAKEYHDKLFKEYCIGDLTHYKTNQIALRWRTKNEVITGKGESICGNRKCNVKEDLKSWEVNFRYVENGKTTNALVKLRLCMECSLKLNHCKTHKQVSYDKKTHRDKKAAHSPEAQHKLDKISADTEDTEPAKESVPKSDNLWGTKDDQDVELTKDQKMDAYLLDLF